MNDHFWPSIYPGIIVGALLGLARGGMLAVTAGALGGTAAAAAMYFIIASLGLEDSIVSLIALIAGAVVGSYLAAEGAARLSHMFGSNSP